MRFRGYGAGLLCVVDRVGGMGRLRGLVSRGFRRLACLGSALSETPVAFCVRTSALMAAPLARSGGLSRGLYVDEEGFDLRRDGEVVEEKLSGRVAASGGGISWVVLARDVSRVYKPIVLLR